MFFSFSKSNIYCYGFTQEDVQGMLSYALGICMSLIESRSFRNQVQFSGCKNLLSKNMSRVKNELAQV